MTVGYSFTKLIIVIIINRAVVRTWAMPRNSSSIIHSLYASQICCNIYNYSMYFTLTLLLHKCYIP